MSNLPAFDANTLKFVHPQFCRHYNSFPPLHPEQGIYGGCHDCHAGISREAVAVERPGKFAALPCFGSIDAPDAAGCARYQPWTRDEIKQAEVQRRGLSIADRRSHIRELLGGKGV